MSPVSLRTFAPLQQSELAARTVRDVIEWFISQDRGGTNLVAHVERQRIRRLFADACGVLTLEEARPLHLLAFINDHAAVKSDWTRKRWAATINATFNHAANVGLIARNPFRGLSLPTGERGEPMEESEFQAILRHSEPAFARLVTALRWTGARPGELAAATWDDFDAERACIELRQHKTARKVGKPRRIILHPVVMKLIAWLSRQPGRGRLIFVNSKGGRWTNPAISWHIRQLREGGWIGPQTTLYGLRHEWACRAVVSGVDLPTIAECMGHERITTTMYYVHCAKRTEHLQAAVAKMFKH